MFCFSQHVFNEWVTEMLSFGMEKNIELCWLKDFNAEAHVGWSRGWKEGATWTETEMKSFQCFMLLIRLLIKCRKPQSPMVLHNPAGDQTVPSATAKPETNLKPKRTQETVWSVRKTVWHCHQLFLLRPGIRKSLFCFIDLFALFIFDSLIYLICQNSLYNL